MGIIFFAFALSAIGLAVLRPIAYSRSGAFGMFLFAASGWLLFMCLMSPVMILQFMLMTGVAMAGGAAGLGPKFLFRGAIVAVFCSFAVVLLWRASKLSELSSLRADYPLESLAPRLAYESSREESPPIDRPSVSLSFNVEQRLQQQESDSWPNARVHMLASLHTRTADDFVLAQGFGPVRMIGVRAERIELPEIKRVPLPVAPQYDSPSERDGAPFLGEIARLRLPSAGDLQTVHARGVYDLLNRDRMGYIQDRDHVAGFVAHQFTAVPDLSETPFARLAWQIVRLELISLLRHPAPVAYVSKDLPRMKELEDAVTRQLTLFELQALERLRTDEDVVIHEGTGKIEMVGSLRAGKSCLECHNARRGDLLGALSYELTPAGAPPAPPNQKIDDPQASARPTLTPHSFASAD